MMDGTHWRRRGPDWETCGRCGVRGRETVAQRGVRLRQGFHRRSSSYGGQVDGRDGATYPWLIMLSLGRERGPLYVSAKRTHRFLLGKQMLNGCEANRSDTRKSGFSVGSFWETNPIWRVF